MSDKSNIKRGKSRVGLYSTLIFHLSIFIILLSVSINSVVQKESTFVLDFTKQEEMEEEQRKIELKESVSRELDALLSSNRNVRNVAVDASRPLRDDRHRNPNQVYDEARELQRKLDASRRDAMSEQSSEDRVDLTPDKEQDSSAEDYRGPSVISYTLDGRKARKLEVPAYKWYGAGDVYVQIVVNQKGKVIGATVIDGVSTSNEALHSLAIAAAKRSRFSASTSAPKEQIGEIVYRFISQ